MEKEQASSHILKSDYSAKGKLRDLIIGWTIYIIFLAVTRIPETRAALLNFWSELRFLTSSFWYFFGIFMIIGTVITLKKKHPYNRLNIYNTGIGFVNKDDGSEKYLDYAKIQLTYGNMRESFIFELLETKKTRFEYAWKEFSNSDILKNNLERYGTWGIK